MITIGMRGGLGNQLFQWALHVSLGMGPNEVQLNPVRLETGARKYLLDTVGLRPRLGSAPGRIIMEGSLHFKPEILFLKGNAILEGYWQSAQYFDHAKDRIRNSVRLFRISRETEAMAAKIRREEQSCFLHIRRTDYCSAGSRAFHGLLSDTSYYQDAMAYVAARCPKAHFFIFSDDQDWIRGRDYGAPATIVDINPPSISCDGAGNIQCSDVGREAEDLWLMSLCRHGIISNSSFSWWGAWLGDIQERVVVAPKRWFAAAHMQGEDRDIVPAGWMRL